MKSKLQRDSGQSTAVNVLIVLALVVAGYFAWIYIPVVWNYMNVKDAVRVAAASAYRNRSTDQVRDALMKSWKELAIQDQTLSDGQIETSPTPLNRDEDIDVELEKDPPMVTVTLRYTQKVVWPLLKKEKEKSWVIHHVEDLKNISY